MGDGVNKIHQKIGAFRKKYYVNIFLRGTILTLSILAAYFLMAALLEYNLWLADWARLGIFITFFAVATFCVFKYLREPIRWWLLKRGLNEEESARLIGAGLPSVKDRLVNLVQLTVAGKSSSLAIASVQQRSHELAPISFEEVIDLRQNGKYLRYLAAPVLLVLLLLVFDREVLTQSTSRIIHFNQQYAPQAPFTFHVNPQGLTAFYNEDYVLELLLDGKAIPDNAYVINGNTRSKMNIAGKGAFSFVFDNIQQNQTIQIEAAGFYSEPFTIRVANRPEMTGFSVELEYPKYLQQKNERIVNAGNLEVPEGTVVKWNLQTAHADLASISFGDATPNEFQSPDNQVFMFSKRFVEPSSYLIELQNADSKNKERIAYNIAVVKDQYPQIAVNNLKDSILYKRIILGGLVSDDHGVSQLTLHYTVQDENQRTLTRKATDLSIGRNQIQQSFFYNWALDSLDLRAGNQLTYYLQVWDNDGVNGRKSTKTTTYSFFVPSKDNLLTEISKSQSQTQQSLDQSVGKANKLQDKIEEASQKLKGKQNLDWQDKKMLEDILQQKLNLDKAVQQLNEENKMLEEKKDAFTEQDERIKEKAEQIQKLMNELLDEETKKLFEELQKLLQENRDISEIQKLLNKMSQNTNNLEKELERTLELFKQLQYDFKLDQTIDQIKEQAEKQKDLLEKTESLEKEQSKQGSKDNKNSGDDKKNDSQKGDNDSKDGKDDGSDKAGDDKKQEQPSSAQDLAKEQEKLKQSLDKTSEKLEELKELGEELNQNDNLPGSEENEQIQQEMDQSQQQLQQNQPSKSKQNQQKAIQQMQQMAQQMESTQSSMSMEIDMENLESLRQIMHGLIKLSFDQESLMNSFNDLQQSDPRFNSLAQQQIKLQDDAKVLEDSLLALAKKDPFMGSFVTKEVGELNGHMQKVIESNAERRRPQAAAEMQYTMTSINNLALMLDSHFDMMMQMMANAKPSSGKGKKKGQMPNLSQLQQQLNDRIQELKNGGKSGRELSEELAKMAAEQERIRRALQELQEKMKNPGEMPGGDIPGKMEQTEMELVNKQLSEELIKRQQEILTRLLEAEKSLREQEMDEERKGEAAKDYDKEIPKAFEEYLRLKEKEVELLKTVPPKLYPYYKKEVSEYFKRIGEQ